MLPAIARLVVSFAHRLSTAVESGAGRGLEHQCLLLVFAVCACVANGLPARPGGGKQNTPFFSRKELGASIGWACEAPSEGLHTLKVEAMGGGLWERWVFLKILAPAEW